MLESCRVRGSGHVFNRCRHSYINAPHVAAQIILMVGDPTAAHVGDLSTTVDILSGSALEKTEVDEDEVLCCSPYEHDGPHSTTRVATSRAVGPSTARQRRRYWQHLLKPLLPRFSDARGTDRRGGATIQRQCGRCVCGGFPKLLKRPVLADVVSNVVVAMIFVLVCDVVIEAIPPSRFVVLHSQHGAWIQYGRRGKKFSS